MKIKLCVLFGGRSVEHEVSIITALQAINKIDKAKYEGIPVYIDKDGRWFTGNMLLDIEIYRDLELLKRYCENKNAGKFFDVTLLKRFYDEACSLIGLHLVSEKTIKNDVKILIRDYKPSENN